MASILLPRDFKEFLQLLNENQVEYLLVGGYAVGYYGYPRATGDMDLWVASTQENAARLVRSLLAFGFSPASVAPELFLESDRIVRMGVPPMRIEMLTDLSGVEFFDCLSRRQMAVIDGMEVPLISLDDLKANKKAAGRLKDLSDLENLP